MTSMTLDPIRRRALMLAPILVLSAACGEAPSPEGGAAVAASDRSAAEAAGSAEAVVANLQTRVEIAHDKLMALAEAMPEDDYGWQPMDGVRTVGDVFIHVAADNWFGPALMGIDAPAWTGVTTDDADVRAYQERELTKAQILEEMETSFQHLLAAMESSASRAGEEISLRGNVLTVADLWVRLVVHMHEHLGQGVAYARSRGVVPPWSR